MSDRLLRNMWVVGLIAIASWSAFMIGACVEVLGPTTGEAFKRSIEDPDWDAMQTIEDPDWDSVR